MSPTIDSDGVPDSCLSLTVRSAWGHFKRVGRSVTKQTYRIPPRTTVAGMLAAIVGSDRDSYYEVFAADVSAIAITSLSDIRTLNIPTTGLGTDPGASVTDTAGGSSQKYALTYQRTEGDRQLHSYEVLADPAYRIDVALEDQEYYRTLRDRLDSEEFYYVPSLGKSEYLCTVENIDVNPEVSAVEKADKYDIDSVVPISLSAAVPQPGVTYGIERSPAIMERDSGGRRTTRFDDYVYTRTADATVRVSSNAEITPVEIGGRTVVFR